MTNLSSSHVILTSKINEDSAQHHLILCKLYLPDITCYNCLYLHVHVHHNDVTCGTESSLFRHHVVTVSSSCRHCFVILSSLFRHLAVTVSSSCRHCFVILPSLFRHLAVTVSSSCRRCFVNLPSLFR